MAEQRAEFEAWAKQAGWPHYAVNADGTHFCSSSSWEPWQAATQRQQERIAELQAQVQALSRDAERLNWIEREYVQVDTFAMPTGGDDADVGWTLKEWHEGECVPRLIHRHYRDDLREAIDAAIAAGKGEVNG